MKRPRIGLSRLWPLALLGLPPICWALILTTMPTDWVRARIVTKLEAATGHPISLKNLRIGILGGVRLSGLEIAAPDTERDPWLAVDSARINVSVLQLLAGQVEPSEVEIDGLSLRVLRRRDGTLELADFLRPGPGKRGDASDPGTQPARPHGLEIRVRGARITLTDEPSGTHLVLAEGEGYASWQGKQVTLQEFKGTLNGGPFELAASLDQTSVDPAFELRFRGQRITLDGGTPLLAYVAPVLATSPDIGSVSGQFEANVYLKGQGTTREALGRSLVGQGAFRIEPVTLEGSRLMAEIDGLVDLPEQARVGSIRSNFTITNGRVATDDLTLKVAQVPIILTGWTDFEGNLDYRVRSERLASRLPSQARSLLADLKVDLNGLSALRIRGTLDAMQVTVDDPTRGALAGDEPPRRRDDRRKLRDLGRRFRDRVLR